VHGAYVADQEVHKVVGYLKSLGQPEYVEGLLEAEEVDKGEPGLGEQGGESDPLYDQAVEIVLRTRRPSISLVQRYLRIGYNRAARLIEQMEQAGLVSSMQSNGNREVLVPAKVE
jgi:S-DNA-T family DNA segregation ATPase FtsK/SpoIIIE